MLQQFTSGDRVYAIFLQVWRIKRTNKKNTIHEHKTRPQCDATPHDSNSLWNYFFLILA